MTVVSALQKNLELGREKLAHGDYPAALTHADAALVLDATSFEALQLRSRALYLLGRDAEALQTLRQVHAVLHTLMPAGPDREPPVEPEPPEDAPFTNDAGQGTDALETLLALRERYQLDADLLALLAELAEDAGRYEIARGAYEELVALDPSQLDAWEGLVHVLSHEDLDAALQTVERARARYPVHPLFCEFLGFIRYRRRQFRQAIAAYEQAVELGADHLENWQALVQCHLTLGETERATELTERLTARWMNEVDAQRFAVEVGLQCGQPEAALQHAHQLVRLQPSHAETYCYKGWVEVALGDWEAVERTLRLGFHKAVDGGFALFELVELLISTGLLDDALRVADLACELAPDHPESSASRGKVLREMGAFTEALGAFRQAAALAPQDDAYQTWMGVVLDNMGDYHEALRQFNHVLSRHPADVWTLSNRGLSYLALEMAERALADFSRGIELDPQDAPLYFWRACALVKLGDFSRALQDLRRAVDLSDDIQSWLEQEPSLGPLRHDPRFREILHRAEAEG